MRMLYLDEYHSLSKNPNLHKGGCHHGSLKKTVALLYLDLMEVPVLLMQLLCLHTHHPYCLIASLALEGKASVASSLGGLSVVGL